MVFKSALKLRKRQTSNYCAVLKELEGEKEKKYTNLSRASICRVTGRDENKRENQSSALG